MSLSRFCLIGIFVDPVGTLRGCTQGRRAWILPLSATLIGAAMIASIWISHIDGGAFVARVFPGYTRLAPDQQARVLDRATTAARWGAAVDLAASVIIIPLVLALIAWCALSFISVESRFEHVFSVVMYASYTVSLSYWVVAAVIFYGTDSWSAPIPDVVRSSVGDWSCDRSVRMTATCKVADAIDIFSLWKLWLIGIGVSIATNRPLRHVLVFIGLAFAIYLIGLGTLTFFANRALRVASMQRF